MRHLPPPWAVFKVRIDRFSPYFMRPDQYGLKLRPKAFYDFVYPIDGEPLHDLAYYFDDLHAATAEYAAAAVEWHPILNDLVRDWFAAWHVRDPAKRPALFVDTRAGLPGIPGIHVLHDSRQHKMPDVAISGELFEALTVLAKPTRLTDLIAKLADSGCGDPASVIEELRARRLVFEDGDRMVGLAHLGPRPICPAPTGGL